MHRGTETIVIPGPVGPLAVLVVLAVDEVTGIAVICHPNPLQGGTNTNKVVQTVAKTLSKRGYVCYCPNFRGVGESAGQHDYGVGEVDDVLAVIEYAQVVHGKLPLALAGFSFGAVVAIHSYQRSAADRLLLLGIAAGKYPLATLPTPTPADMLVIHGEQDEVIPLTSVLTWARPQNLPILVLPGAGHFFHGRLIQLGQLILRWWG